MFKRNARAKRHAGIDWARPSMDLAGPMLLQALEPRVLLDAAAAATATHQVADAQALAVQAAHDMQVEAAALVQALSQAMAQAMTPPSVVPPAVAQEGPDVYFIDAALPDTQQLVAALPANAEVHQIAQGSDGVKDIALALQGRSGIGAIHILSHGSAGMLDLGSAVLTTDSMRGQYHDDLVAIGSALTADGDILVYGCDFSAGTAGIEATDTLAAITGADVAASSDNTGAASLGGNWTLETQVGPIEAQSVAAASWGYALAPGPAIIVLWDPADKNMDGIVNGTITQTPAGGTPRTIDIKMTTAPDYGNGKSGYGIPWDTLPESNGIAAGAINAGNVVGNSELHQTPSGAPANTSIVFSHASGHSVQVTNPVLLAAQTDPPGKYTFTDAGITSITIVDQAGINGTVSGKVLSFSTRTGGADLGFAVRAVGTVTGSFNFFTTTTTGLAGDGVDLGLLLTDVEVLGSVNVVPGAQSAVEDMPLVLGGGTAIKVVDIDGLDPVGVDRATTVTLTATNGTMSLSGIAGLTFTAGDGTNDGTMTFSGPRSLVNAALNGLTFRGNPEFSGAAQIQIVSTTADDPGVPNTNIIPINVAPANDAPVLDPSPVFTMPPVAEGGGPPVGAVGSPVSSFAGGNITDVDPGAVKGIAITSAPTTYGVWYFSVNSGTSWTAMPAGSNADALLLSASATNRLYFAPAAGYNGALDPGLTFRAWDTTSGTNGGRASTAANGGDSAFSLATDTIQPAVTQVNKPPVNTLPATFTGNEDVSLPLTGLQVADPDAAGGIITVTLSVNAGTLVAASGAGVSVASSGTSSIQLSGTLASINAYLASAAAPNYISDTNGNGTVSGSVGYRYTLTEAVNNTTPQSDTVQLTMTDGAGNNTAAFPKTMAINIVDDVPLAQNDTAAITEDAVPNMVSGNVMTNDRPSADGNAATIDSISAGFTPAAGGVGVAVAGTYGSITAQADGSYVYTLDNANPTVNALNVGQSLTEVFTYTLTDGDGDTSSATLTVTINGANDAPLNTVPGAQTVGEDVALAFSGANAISVNDVDANLTSVTLTVTNGRLNVSLSGAATFSAGANNSATVTISGTQADINASLATLAYTGNTDFSGSDTLTVLSRDSGGLTDSDTVAITVTPLNDAPINTVPVAGWTTPEETSVALTGLSVADADAGAGAITVTLSVPTGTLTATAGGGVGVTGSGSGSLVLTGTLANINAFLAATAPVYVPVLNANGDVTLTMLTNDGGNTGPGGPLTDSDPAVIDAGLGIVTVQLSVNSGTMSASDAGNVTVTGSGTDTLLLTGTLPDINAYLASIEAPVYTPTLDATGTFALTMVTDDLGNTGAGGSQRDIDTTTVAINIGSFDDPPVNTLPAAGWTTDEDTAIALTGLKVADVDAGLGLISVQLSVDAGTITANNLGGITVTNSGTSSITLTGRLFGINLYLASPAAPVYHPAPDGNGTVTLTMLTDDNGNTGTGGPLSYTVSDGNATGSGALSFNTVPNTPPVAQADIVALDEDTPLSVPAASGLLANDSDADGDALAITGYSVAGLGAFAPGTPANIAGVGVLTVNADGSYSFVPAPDYNGPVPAVSYTVSDGSTTRTGTLSLSVTPVNDVPAVGNGGGALPGGGTIIVGADSGLLAGASDIDGDQLVITSFTVEGVPGPIPAGTPANIPGVGVLTINPDGSYTFVPDASFSGPLPKTIFTVSDGEGGTATGELSLDVVAQPQPPAPSGDAPVNPTFVFVYAPGDATQGPLAPDAMHNVTGAVLGAVADLGNVGISTLLSSDNVILKAVNDMGSLNGTHLTGEDTVLGSPAGYNAISHATGPNAPLAGSSLGGPGARAIDAGNLDFAALNSGSSLRLLAAPNRTDVILEMQTRGRQIWIGVDDTLDTARSPILRVAVTLADGSPLPPWIRVDASGLILIEAPAGTELIGLRITVLRRNGETHTHTVDVDASANQLLDRTATAPQRSANGTRADAKHIDHPRDFATQLAQASRRPASVDAELLEALA
ncbi:DUF4347 domain-containing protein [Variovorax rhizosphaerae]|uniref:DUF4347 domain-containing protein n=1 Tax=Variovorax rhizosphaerae TaxID=1836200 RepID=A0ABU8WIL1_9BURK